MTDYFYVFYTSSNFDFKYFITDQVDESDNSLSELEPITDI